MSTKRHDRVYLTTIYDMNGNLMEERVSLNPHQFWKLRAMYGDRAKCRYVDTTSVWTSWKPFFGDARSSDRPRT